MVTLSKYAPGLCDHCDMDSLALARPHRDSDEKWCPHCRHNLRVDQHLKDYEVMRDLLDEVERLTRGPRIDPEDFYRFTASIGDEWADLKGRAA